MRHVLFHNLGADFPDTRSVLESRNSWHVPFSAAVFNILEHIVEDLPVDIPDRAVEKLFGPGQIVIELFQPGSVML